MLVAILVIFWILVTRRGSFAEEIWAQLLKCFLPDIKKYICYTETALLSFTGQDKIVYLTNVLIQNSQAELLPYLSFKIKCLLKLKYLGNVNTIWRGKQLFFCLQKCKTQHDLRVRTNQKPTCWVLALLKTIRIIF